MESNTSDLLKLTQLLDSALNRALAYQTQRDNAEKALAQLRQTLTTMETERNAFEAEVRRLHERLERENERVLFQFFPNKLMWDEAGERFAEIFNILTGGSRDPIDMSVLIENGRHFVTTRSRFNAYVRAMPQCEFKTLEEHEAQSLTEL